MGYDFSQCRFCHKDIGNAECVKYSTRHYAHFNYYLDAGKKITDLTAWQAERFPYRLLEERGLLQAAKEMQRLADA